MNLKPSFFLPGATFIVIDTTLLAASTHAVMPPTDNAHDLPDSVKWGFEQCEKQPLPQRT